MVRPNNFKTTKNGIEIVDQIWFAPEGDSYSFSGFETLFGRKKPLCLEYCSGNGLWIANKAMAHPDLDWIGVEMKYKRIQRIWAKIQNHQIKNLIGVCGEAYSWTTRFVADQTIHKVFINFPDPWPKRKHTKYRLINPRFVTELARIVEKGGEVMVVTDHAPYSEEVQKHFGSSPDFVLKGVTNSCEGYGSSYFEDLWRKIGLDIHYLTFVRL